MMHKFISFCCVVLFLIGGASSISSPAFAQSIEPYPVDPPTPTPFAFSLDSYPVQSVVATQLTTTQPTTATATTNTIGIVTAGMGNIDFNEQLDCTLQSNQDNIGWQYNTLNVGDKIFRGFWPGGSAEFGSTPLYPNDLSALSRCKWDAKHLSWQDPLTGRSYVPVSARLTFDLWLNLVDLNDSVTIKLFHGSSTIWSKQYTRTNMSIPIDTISVDTKEINYGSVGAGNDDLYLQYYFQSDAQGSSEIGAMIGNVKLYLSHGDSSIDCSNWDLTAKNRAGINLGYRIPGKETFYISQDDPRVLYDLQQLGVNWVRFVFLPKIGLNGAYVDTNNDLLGDIDYDSYNYMIDNLCERKILVMPVLGVESLIGIGEQQNYFLTKHGFIGANGKPDLNEFIKDPLFLQLIELRAKELATAYSHIQNWEILNEPDVVEEFIASSGRYTQILKVASRAIKSVIPNATIIFGGLSNTWQNGGLLFLQNEYDTPYNLSVGFDQLGVHPYTDNGYPTYRGNSPNDYFFRLDAGLFGQTILDPLIREMYLRDSVSTNKKVQITEIGFDTSPKKKPIPGTLSGAGANPCAYLYGTLVTEEEQREYLKQAYSILLSSSRVDKVIWYRYDDIYQSAPADAIDLDCGQATANWQKDRWVSVPVDPMGVTARQFNPQLVYLTHWFGLRDVNGHIKPAYCAMTEVTGAGSCPLSNPIYLPIIELSRGNFPMPAIYLTAEEIPPTAVSLHRQTVTSSSMQLVIVTVLLLSATILLLLIDVGSIKLVQRQSVFCILLMLLVGCAKVEERGKATLTLHTVRLPIVQKDVTITIPPVPTPTIQKVVTPTNTRPANPYHPIIKTLIDTNGEVGEVVVNSKTNVAYAADNYQLLLKITNGIPDFDHQHQLPSGIKQLLFDEDNNRLYAMSRIYVDMITEGVAVIENDQLQGYIPFPGRVRGMVFDSTRHWVYVYGIPNKESDPELIDSNLGVLMIIEGTRVIKTIKPWDVRVMQATADPVHGHVYFSSQYIGPPRPDTDTTYGRVTILDGENEIGMVEGLYSNLNSLFFNPTYNSIYAFTSGQRKDIGYIFEEGKLVHTYFLASGYIVDGVIHPWTQKSYLLNWGTGESYVLIGTNEKFPTIRKSIPLTGTSVGFVEIIADPFSGNVYVRNVRDSTITVIHDEEIIGTFELTRDTDSMSLNPTNGDLYVSSSRAGDIWILGFEEGTVFP